MGEIKNYTLPNTKPACVRYLPKRGYVSPSRILRQKEKTFENVGLVRLINP